MGSQASSGLEVKGRAQLAQAARQPRSDLDDFFREAYAELRRLARHRLKGAKSITSLNATSLLHECYLKLHQSSSEATAQRCSLPYLASAMRSIVIDHIRKRQADRARIDDGIDPDSIAQSDSPSEREREALLVDEALRTLGQTDTRLVSVVEMKFFAGFDEAEIAQALSVDPRTVRRDWSKARAMLRALIVR